jgi:hypothetical protein
MVLNQAQDDNLLWTKVYHEMKQQKGTCIMRSMFYGDRMPHARP